MYYNGEFRVIWHAITLAVQCRLSDMLNPLREGSPFPCSLEIIGIVPFCPQIENLFSYVRCPQILSLFPSKFGLFPLFP